ncbi:hypothetical protein AVEN_49338-1 [Araneus ventricosus]|uniref:Uncharacterized protein n=1 Tax=Araneus ventricosus TaxID=182803 RepID=A0A4Y2HA75_ARAVE|nr:hypothetical protein AVEN_49338-1 [Araneus ventricosus]
MPAVLTCSRLKSLYPQKTVRDIHLVLSLWGAPRIHGCRISKRVLASSEGTIKVWACPLPVIVRTFFGRGRAVAGDGRWDSGLSTRAVAATVTQIHRTENTPDRGDIGMYYA